MQPRAYREGKAVGDLKESVFKAYIVQIRRLRGNLGLLLLQSTSMENKAAAARLNLEPAHINPYPAYQFS